jgi:putative flippase GtrA
MFKPSFFTFVRFSLVGALNTLIDFLVFFLLNHGLGVFYLWAQIASYSCGVFNSFLFNKYWTFRKRRTPFGNELVKFLIVNFLSLVVSVVILYSLNTFFHFDVILSKLITTFSGVTFNFVGSKFWVFNPNAKLRSERA